MKLHSPTIYVRHKLQGQWAVSALQFDGHVDRRRVKREIIKAFKRGGVQVHSRYVEASIQSSIKVSLNAVRKWYTDLLDERATSSTTAEEKRLEDIYEAEHASAQEA